MGDGADLDDETLAALGKKGGTKGTRGNRYSCGKPGHMAANCLSWKGAKPSALSDTACFRCGKPGHLAYHCTLPRVHGQEKPTPPPAKKMVLCARLHLRHLRRR